MRYLSLSIPGFEKLDSGLPVPTGGLSTGNKALGALIEIVLIGAILFALYTIIRGGINMITSGGHKEKFQMGRERVRYAVIGLIVIFMSFFMVNMIGKIFGITFPLFSFK